MLAICFAWLYVLLSDIVTTPTYQVIAASGKEVVLGLVV
jgi:hypothetical protein